jgi:hypothetical protein
MVKKLLLIACVVLLVGAVGISDIRAQQQEELAYDDGGDEGQGIAGFVGEVLAVVFTPTQYPAILKRVRIFVNTATPYRLRVYDVADVNSGPTLDLLAGLIQIPTTSGWHTVDLSVYNITINSGQQRLNISLLLQPRQQQNLEGFVGFARYSVVWVRAQKKQNC